MAAAEVKSGHYYRFCNKSSGKVLNFSTANGTNVNVKAENGEPDQINGCFNQGDSVPVYDYF